MSVHKGRFNQKRPFEAMGLTASHPIHYNLNEAQLYEAAIRRGEGLVAANGPLAVTTGVHTGRSAQDKFIVRDATTEDSIWWDNNKAMTPAHFATLKADILAHAGGRELFVQDLYGGADPAHRIAVRVVTELAWHALFIRYLLRRPSAEEVAAFEPELHIINMPSFKADPGRHGVRSDTVIASDLAERLVLIGSSEYAGETKKSVFGTLNYFLPAKGILPMHCSANADADGVSALFFGLSGTGKTTLSSDARRTLIGDDEHGWADNGVFNFEGGCYAKTIRLSAEAEPEIYSTTQRWGSVLENVWIDPETRLPDFDDASLTENGRVAYPMHFIPNASETGMAGHPRNVIMLTADAFGVMPPIARLTAGPGDVSFPVGLYRQGGGDREGRQRHPGDVFDLFRRPLHAAPSECLRQPSEGKSRPPWRHLLAGQYRLDRRSLRRGPPHADQGDADAAGRRPRRQPQVSAHAHRSVLRLRGASGSARRRCHHPRSARNLEGQGRL